MTPDPRDFSRIHRDRMRIGREIVCKYFVLTLGRFIKELSFKRVHIFFRENFRYVLLIDEWLVRAIFVASFLAEIPSLDVRDVTTT